jgi:probable rRNA maturation factor
VRESSEESRPAAERFHIEFFFDGVGADEFAESDKHKLRAAIMATLDSEQVGQAEISVAIVSGNRMQQLNNQYLQHDYDTDVLSFCLEEEHELGFMLGQLVVSLDYARQQAAQLSAAAATQVDWSDELALYLVHGTLHLVGYDDHEPDDRREMRAAEKLVLGKLGIEPVWLADATVDATGLNERSVVPLPVDAADPLT